MQGSFDIVHVTQSLFPDDPRPRRESAVAADVGARVAVVALAGLNQPTVGRYGRIAVVRLRGSKRRGSAIRYVLEYLSFLARAYVLLRADPRFRGSRVVHVHSLPDFLVAAARPLRRRGARVILDLHEIFPEFARAKFRGLAGRIVGRLVLFAEAWSRRQADVVLTVNRAVATLLRARGPAEERLVIIHNLPDRTELGDARLPDGRIGDPIQLVYHGTLTGLYGLDLAIETIARARSAGLNATFDIFGSGPDAPLLASQIDRMHLGDYTRLRGILPHDRLRATLTTYHAAFIPTRLNEMTAYSLSTKLIEYVHLGVPILAPRIPTYLSYFPNESLWYYAPNDADDAVRALRDLTTAAGPERIERSRLAQGAIRDLTWSSEAERLARIYRELLGTTGGTP